MRLFLVSVFILAVTAQQEFIQNIICPLPGNPSPALVTEEECNLYTACTYTNGNCHMKLNNESGYIVSTEPVDTGRGFYVLLDKAVPANTLFGADVQQLVLEVVNHEDYHVQIKIYDPLDGRYEVPFPLNLPDQPGTEALYSTTIGAVGNPLTLTISRVSNGNQVFRIAGPLTFEDQFLQLTLRLASTYLYGIGEHSRTSLRRNFDPRETYPVFARDQGVFPAFDNLYGSHPYYVNVEDDEGNTHSVLLYNSNAMEFSTFFLGDNVPAVTMRTIGGILDFHVFLGPTPEEVNVQYANTVGLPCFPPYWAFGFHLSRWGYDTTDNYRIVYDRMKAAAIPWDSQTFDIDYMDGNRDFTYDPVRFADFPQLIQELHDANMKVILIHDPAVVADWDIYPPAERGRNSDVFIKWASTDLVPADQPADAGNYLVGKVWPENRTVFPDFLNPNTTAWWSNELELFHQQLAFDGIWIDMNEPANFATNIDGSEWSLKCPNNTLDKPPYGTLAAFSDQNESEKLSDHSICMSTNQTDGVKTYLHYDVHSLFGFTESIASFRAANETIFPNKRPFVLSRSTFVGSGQYAVHWLGDNTANWEQIRMSLIGIMEFNFFAIPFVGADVCGFGGEPDEELCIRWMQAGAFYPFDRNHNSIGLADQDPAKPGWDLAPIYSRDVLLLRYKYIPYLYARFHRAHMDGNSVIRPLFNGFPNDLIARDIDDQFMWSTDLLVAPVVQQGAISRDIYFPQSLWYDLVTGSLEATGPVTKNIHAPLDTIPVYVRGGSILPFQEPSITTMDSRLNAFGLTVALDENQTASGEYFWDDGEGMHDLLGSLIGPVTFTANELILTIIGDPTIADGLLLETIQFFGIPSNPIGIDVNGAPADISSWTYDSVTSVLLLSLSVPLNAALSVLLTY